MTTALTRTQSPMVSVLSTLSGTVLRMLSDVLDDAISVKRFGAKGDGLADDTLAFANAIASKRKLTVPKGLYRLTSPLSTTGQLVLDGEGEGTSVLIFENCNGFVLTTDTTTVDIHPMTITNLSIQSTGTGVHTALRLNGRKDGFGNQLIVRDNTFSGSAASKCWKICISMTKAVNTVIENNNFLGRRDGDNAYFATMTHAVYADDFSTDVKFIANKVYYCDIGLLVTGELSVDSGGVWHGSNGGEGWTVRDNHIVLVNTGFWSRNNGGNMIVMSGNHIAAKKWGIILGTDGVNGSNHSDISGNFLMKRGDSSDSYVGIESYAANTKICHNEFRVEGTFQAGAENQLVVGGEYTTIIGNNFADADTTAVWLKTTAHHSMLVGNIGGNNGTNIRVDAANVTRALNSFDDEASPQGCLMHKAGDQAVHSGGGWEFVTFDTTVRNTGGFWSAPDAITIPPGVSLVRFTAYVGFNQTGANHNYVVSIRKNGTGGFMGIAGAKAAGDGPAFSIVSGVVPVVPGDAFRVGTLCTLTDYTVSSYSWFQIEVLS